MTMCDKCGLEVSKEDLFEEHGSVICDDCKLKSIRQPSKPCGGEK